MLFTKRIQTLVLILALSIGFSACSDNASEEKKSVAVDKANVLKTVINVDGMTCEGCEASIQGNVAKIDGVVSVKASHTDKTTIVEYDKTQTSEREIAKVISDTGYKIFQESAKEVPKEVPSAMKYGEGKCGAGKCGHAE